MSPAADLGATRRAGLIGHPVGHSISPRFQQAAFDYCHMAVRYELWDTETDRLSGRIAALRKHEYIGANITIPHKQAVLTLVDEQSDAVRLTGAANTIVNADGRLVAHNTDVGGFARALQSELGYDPRGRRAVLLGAGGAARAVAVALAAEGVKEICILNRSSERAAQMAETLAPGLGCRVVTGSLATDAGRRLAGCNLVVNCTSVGLAGTPNAGAMPVLIELVPAGALVVDVVANPLVTPFLAAAGQAGHRTLGGLPMLVHQGAIAFQLWTGLTPPIDVMMAAAKQAMAGPYITGPESGEASA